MSVLPTTRGMVAWWHGALEVEFDMLILFIVLDFSETGLDLTQVTPQLGEFDSITVAADLLDQGIVDVEDQSRVFGHIGQQRGYPCDLYGAHLFCCIIRLR
jgi:hypothetical protein